MRISSNMLPQQATYFSDGPIRHPRSWPSPRPRRAVLAILKTRNRLIRCRLMIVEISGSGVLRDRPQGLEERLITS